MLKTRALIRGDYFGLYIPETTLFVSSFEGSMIIPSFSEVKPPLKVRHFYFLINAWQYSTLTALLHTDKYLNTEKESWLKSSLCMPDYEGSYYLFYIRKVISTGSSDCKC